MNVGVYSCIYWVTVRCGRLLGGIHIHSGSHNCASRIQESEVYTVCHEDSISRKGTDKWLSKFTPRKLNEMKRGSAVFKLEKSVWRFQDEYSLCVRRLKSCRRSPASVCSPRDNTQRALVVYIVNCTGIHFPFSRR